MPLIVGTNLDEGTLLTRAWPVDTRGRQPRADRRQLRACARRGAAASTAPSATPTPSRASPKRLPTRSSTTVRACCCARWPTRRALLALPVHAPPPGAVRRPAPRRRGRLCVRPARGRSHRRPEPFDAADEAVSRAMMRAWVAFAREGDPECGRRDNVARLFGARRTPSRTRRHGRIGTDTRRAQLDFLERYFDLAT